MVGLITKRYREKNRKIPVQNMNLREIIKQHTRPFLIAGPCSVESQMQMMDAAKGIAANTSVSLLRGGIWKPRTRPDSFEGVGALGLPWLVEAGKAINCPVTTEVANARHVELALHAGVDVLWVGARTTANPFAVQEIADALKGVEIPVMIKNPINPDLNLWIGAFERFQNAGLTDLVAIHRGFSVYNHPKYRNEPNWEIPIALMEEMEEIPIICDPSHISGKRAGLLPIAQKSMDLNFAGMMIETHPNPDKAWSDAEQQITPDALGKLLGQLVLRHSSIVGEGQGYMEIQRGKLAEIDNQIFNLFIKRMNIAEEVGDYKRENKITILQTEHWKEIIEQRLAKSEEMKLSREFVRDVLDAIHQESIRHQVKVMNELKKES